MDDSDKEWRDTMRAFGVLIAWTIAALGLGCVLGAVFGALIW